jgi:23S rRNA (uridine2552-2'-O)-methyltransferase
MEPMAGVEVIQGDFTQDAVLGQLRQRLAGQSIDLVLSDLAPNISGDEAIDQPRAMHLAEQSLAFARSVLGPQGSFLVKVFQGAGFPAYLQELRGGFRTVATRKPKASRARSPELFLLAKHPRV